jgi:hypothetical protein
MHGFQSSRNLDTLTLARDDNLAVKKKLITENHFCCTCEYTKVRFYEPFSRSKSLHDTAHLRGSANANCSDDLTP